MILFSFFILPIKTAARLAVEVNSYRYDVSFKGNRCEPALHDSNSLKQALFNFLSKADSGKYMDVTAYYDTGFLSVRVVDAGQFIKMGFTQMVNFWKFQSGRLRVASNSGSQLIVTQSTTVHYIEISGDTAYVLLTRVKDLGHGPEPMFYNLVWVNKKDKWYLFREIVHQRTMPNFH